MKIIKIHSVHCSSLDRMGYSWLPPLRELPQGCICCLPSLPPLWPSSRKYFSPEVYARLYCRCDGLCSFLQDLESPSAHTEGLSWLGSCSRTHHSLHMVSVLQNREATCTQAARGLCFLTVQCNQLLTLLPPALPHHNELGFELEVVSVRIFYHSNRKNKTAG